MSYPLKYRTPSAAEKLIAVLSYIFPLIGFVVIFTSALMRKDMKPFLKYHIFQSIFIAFALWLVISGLTLAMNFISYIPGVKNIVSIVTFFLNTPLFFGFSVVTFAYLIFVLYLILGVLRSSDSYVPWVSNIIKANLRGQL